jgi:Raf kinase inhibitor-like YbhB/YbcL family protein
MNNGSLFLRRMRAAVLGIVLICISVVAAYTGILSADKEKIVMSMNIQSLSFMHEREIPARHTCDGLNTSPPILWLGVPNSAKSLVLIVDDPDAPDPSAPKRTWVHWLLYNIPVSATDLTEGVTANRLPAGTLQGINDWRSTGYGGPCPPIGRHRYFFKLYALDSVLPDLKNPNKATLEKAMQGHVLDQASLIGLYQRHAAH